MIVRLILNATSTLISHITGVYRRKILELHAQSVDKLKALGVLET